MKSKPITQLQLATLAATLPEGSAQERVKQAMSIWLAAADTGRVEGEVYQDKIDALEEKHREPFDMPFAKALAYLLPAEVKAKQREEKWRQFRKWQSENGIDDRSADLDKTLGSVKVSQSLSDQVAQWWKASEPKRNRAKTAAAKRHRK